MSLALSIYRLSPSRVASILDGDATLVEIETRYRPVPIFTSDSAGSTRALEVGTVWDCLWYSFSQERRTGEAAWDLEADTALAWSVVGRHPTESNGMPVASVFDTEPFDRLRVNEPGDVEAAASVLRTTPPLVYPPYAEFEASGVYHARRALGGPLGVETSAYTAAVEGLASFYEAAAREGQSTVHWMA